MNSPLISIVVPCYNQAQYLDECLESVLNQTYDNWECIVVNDGSPDNTNDVIKKWLDKDSRFKYVEKENGGLSSARNAGICQSKGEWILPLDADDKIGLDYLRLASLHFEEGYTVIYCQTKLFGLENGLSGLTTYSTYKRLLVFNNFFCSSFFKKSDWASIGEYDETFLLGYEDWEFWIRLLNSNSQVLGLDYIGFFYRIKEHSMNAAINIENKRNAIYKQIYEKHESVYKQNFGEYITVLRNATHLSEVNDHLEKVVHEPLWGKITRKIKQAVTGRVIPIKS